MRWSLHLVLSLLPIGGLAGKSQEGSSRSRYVRNTSPIQARNNTGVQYVLKDYYRGQSFLDDWEFFSSPDPTHGNVNYQTRENAMAKKLAYVQQDGTTILAVDDFSPVPPGGNRDSVRISTKKKYNGGLFIADFWAMPHGCSVWPAYWSVGPNWPGGGEIDILEGVHEQPTNQYTLHTGPDCSLANSFDEKTAAARLIHPECASSGTDNRGCGFLDDDTRTYGTEFNLLAGGVFVHLWDSRGIKVWRFLRDSIPADISSQKPDPSTWPTPAAFFPSTNCDMASHFYEHALVLDTTVCGDFGGPTYASSGCPGTCAEAISNTTNFKWAKWKLNYIAVYN
ncbi:glycoside hydrolase family 16 protein [Crassisporium funariophilum]|nr:glycoside hydrolase family 16 protein [Crassisporium funariophilum]